MQVNSMAGNSRDNSDFAAKRNTKHCDLTSLSSKPLPVAFHGSALTSRGVSMGVLDDDTNLVHAAVTHELQGPSVLQASFRSRVFVPNSLEKSWVSTTPTPTTTTATPTIAPLSTASTSSLSSVTSTSSIRSGSSTQSIPSIQSMNDWSGHGSINDVSEVGATLQSLQEQFKEENLLRPGHSASADNISSKHAVTTQMMNLPQPFPPALVAQVANDSKKPDEHSSINCSEPISICPIPGLASRQLDDDDFLVNPLPLSQHQITYSFHLHTAAVTHPYKYNHSGRIPLAVRRIKVHDTPCFTAKRLRHCCTLSPLDREKIGLLFDQIQINKHAASYDD